MRTKKRTRSSRWRGSHTHGRGFKKKARGSGHQGGKGMAGTGKRGDAKKTMILNLYGNDYFGKDRTLRRGHVAPKLQTINLGQVQRDINSMVAKESAKEVKGVYEINLTGYKVLGEGEFTLKAKITATSASASAQEKVQSAGGEFVLRNSESKEVKVESKPAAKAAPKAK
jgi:large subunit ribosomal protein L15